MNGKCFSAANRGQRKKSDFYQTPYSMTEQLLEIECFNGSILEPCSGDGAILSVINKEYDLVFSNEVRNSYEFDFIKEEFVRVDNIITNPPFSLAFEFIEKSKSIYNKKIAMLLPLSYLHGQKRYDEKIFNELKSINVFTRYPLLTDTIRSDGKYNTGMIAYAWYIWEKGYNEKPVINWINNQKFVLKKGEINE